MQDIDPHRQAHGGEQCRENDDAAGENGVISCIFHHDIAGGGGGGAQHDKNGHKLLVPVTQIDCQGKKQGTQ